MRKYILLTLLLIIYAGIANAYRIPKPDRITEYNDKGLVVLNDNLEKMWDITNGRYTLNIVTSNPDGSLRGDVGSVLLFNDSGTYYLEINVDGGKTWRGVQLTDTP